MDLKQKQLVQESWARVEPIAAAASLIFYNKLFELDPSIKPMFKHVSIETQGEKLMVMVGMAVRGLDNLDALLPQLKILGQRHVGYGVKYSHYDTVATALLETLAQGLGKAFTPEVKNAWVATYTLLADVMKSASKQPANPAGK